jgi:uncharacterized membrane protein HdeD (DUF308 family)
MAGNSYVVLTLGAIGVIALGVFLVARPGRVSKALMTFYSKYPLVRYAGERQLTGRNAFVVALGIVLIVTGLVGLLGILVS